MKIIRPEQELFATLLYFSEAKTCVEIGVATGNTTAELCKAIARNNGMVYGFDIWERHGLLNQYKSPHNANKEDIEKKIKSEGFTNFVLTKVNTRLERDRFEKELDKLCPDGIDFVFIDGCHSYQGVANDFCAVYPRLTKAGMIAFHDTIICDGSREFMLDLRTKYYDGTYDVVDFYGGRQKQTRVGISVLIKRAFPITNDPIIELCGSHSMAAEIEQGEVDWYEKECSGKKPANVLISEQKESVNKTNLLRSKFTRPKFQE